MQENSWTMLRKWQRMVHKLLLLWVTCVLVFLVLYFPERFKRNAFKKGTRDLNRNSALKIKTDRNDSIGPRHAIARRISKSQHEEYFKLREKKVNQLKADFLIQNRDFCATVDPYLLIVVPSIATHRHVRSAIRKTYGSREKIDGINKISKVVFFFGRGENEAINKMIKEESEKHRDIVQADFIESYANLTLKMMVILKWVATYCGGLEFMLKIDEDMFVNIPLLVSSLRHHPYPMKGAVYGFIHHFSSVRRLGKWAVNREQYPLPTYPTYASGNSYVISGNAIPRMFMVSEYMPYMPIEDVFVTGILAEMVGAKHIRLNGFTYWMEEAPDPCKFVAENRISATKVDAELMFRLWDTLNSYDTFCSAENATTS